MSHQTRNPTREDRLKRFVKDRQAWDDLKTRLWPISDRIMKNIDEGRTFALEFQPGSGPDELYKKALGL